MADQPVAVITGASRGLGLALARRLGEQGFVTVLLARGADDLDRARAQLEASGGVVETHAIDVTDAAALARVAEATRARWGRVDFLVNNAGTGSVGLLVDVTPERVRRDLEVTLLGSILATQAFLPAMEPGARLLFVASTLGLVGAAGYAPYCAAKAGLVNFADAMRHELAPRGIAVHVAVPADVDTPGYREELAELPDWMALTRARGKPMGAAKAAARIVDGCLANRPVVFSDRLTRAVDWANKLLPRRLRNRLFNRFIPAPDGPCDP